MIHHRNGIGMILTLALALGAVGLSGCATAERSAKSGIAAKPHKAAATSVKAPKTRSARTKADPVRTASLAPVAEDGARPDLTGRTFVYRLAGARGTITYRPDGTSLYEEPGIRRGTGKWHLQDGKLCQSFSGISEPCHILRRSGENFYAGPMTLVAAKQ